jgi:hypothetical protein
MDIDSLAAMMSAFSITILDTPVGREQFRFPRTKKWRIRKKWAKRPGNFRNVFLQNPIVDAKNRRIFCTSKMFEQLKKAARPHT